MLKIFSGDIERKRIRVNQCSEEIHVFWKKIFKLIIDQNLSNVKFNFWLLFIEFLELIIRSSFRDKDKTSEFSLTLSSEMRVRKWITWLLKHIFIEVFVLFSFDFWFSSCPKRFIFIDSFELNSINILSNSSVDGIFNLFLIDFFTLLLPFLSFLFNFSFNLSLSFLDFLFSCNNLFQVNWIWDKTTVSLNQSLELVILAIFRSIFFQIQSNDGSSLEIYWIISLYGKNIWCWRCPFVLSIIIMFWDDFNSWCN